MKTILLKIALVLILVSGLSAQWQTVTVNSSLSFMQHVSIADEFNIWTVSINTSDNIYRSSDGGVTWINAGSVGERIYFISAVNGSKAWVSTLSGKIFRTTNGGLNWVNQPYSHEEFVNFLHFYDENNGIFLADPLIGSDTIGFFYTRNGGVNWIRSVNAPVINPSSLALFENCANTLDTNMIWFAANVGNGIHMLYKLTGGFDAAWQSYEFDITGPYRNLVFKDLQNGLAADNNKIIATTNGGLNWSLKNSDVSGTFIVDFFNVPQTNWVVLNCGNQLKLSKDFCSSWFTQTNYTNAGYGNAGDTNSIWLANSNGTLLKYNILAIGIIGISSNVSNSFELGQNYPNPFNPTTTITFLVPANAANDGASNVLLQVYNVQGKLVETLVNSNLNRGEYSINWSGENFASGVYYYKLIAGSQIETRKMILLK